MRHLGEKLSPAIADTHKSATRDRRRIFHYRLRIHPLRKPPFSHCPETARSKSSPQGPTKPHDCRSAILPLSMPSRDRSCSDPAHLYRRREYPLACQRAGKGSKQIELLRRRPSKSRRAWNSRELLRQIGSARTIHRIAKSALHSWGFSIRSWGPKEDDEKKKESER